MINTMIWWTGVVEDRKDPELLGRCRVRIFGYHTEDTTELPTSDLPWAIPMQPVISAATSGIGYSPLGLVEGSWVVGFFLDGQEGQQPVIMGSIAGKPSPSEASQEKLELAEKESNNVFKDSDGNVVFDSLGNPIILADDTVNPEKSLLPLTQADYTRLKVSLAAKLSGNNPTKVGTNGELGLYQFTVRDLVEFGYVTKPLDEKYKPELLDDPANWVGKSSIKSKAAFLNSESAQNTLMIAKTKENYNTLLRTQKIRTADDKEIVAGLLASAHVVSAENADKLDIKTPDGVLAQEYFANVVSQLGGTATTYDRNYLDTIIKQDIWIAEQKDSVANNSKLADSLGFQDPNKIYPKFDYLNKPDTNKLSTGDTSHKSFAIKNNSRIKNIPVARSSKNWSEPPTAYAAIYPNNHVIETEAGHLIELDNTPNAERIHIYHKTGTYIEVDVNGSMVKKTIGENYEVIDRNNFVYVKGANNLTVEGKTNIYVKHDASIEVDGSLYVTSHGDATVQAAGVLGLNADNILLSGKKSVDISSAGSINLQGKEVNLYAKGGALTGKSTTDVAFQSGSLNKVSLKGGLAVDLDAVVIREKMGAASIGAIDLPTLDLPERKNPTTPEIEELQRPLIVPEVYAFDTPDDDPTEFIKSQIADGSMNNNIVPKVATTRSIISGIPTTKVVSVDTDELLKYKTIPNTYRLSKYFRLQDLLIGRKGQEIRPYLGFDETGIVANLKKLAVNCLDPIKEKYPRMIISSGFRYDPPSKSQHSIGCAADMVFPGIQAKDYKEIAEWIHANVPFSQLLLEYKQSRDRGLIPWIHIGLYMDKNNKIVPSNKSPVATFYNHKEVASLRFISYA